MKNNYRKLGDYIQPVDVRNSDLKVSHLLGLSIEKCFIESIANTIGTDFRPYKIVKKGQFAYGPVTSRNGDKITIALLKEADVCIISSSYSVFEITDTTKLLPEYLMLWFSRPEFDRYARYKSHGSVREIFDWDEMCRVELPIPDLKEQEKIVNTYNAITKRIQLKQKINENLEKTAILKLENMLNKKSLEKKSIKIESICEVKGGKRLPLDSDLIENRNSHPYIRIRDLKENCFVVLNNEFLYVDEETQKEIARYITDTNDLLISIVGTIGLTALVHKSLDKANLTENCVKLIKMKNLIPEYVLIYLRSKTGQYAISQATVGAVQAKLPLKNILNLDIPCFDDSIMKEYNDFLRKSFACISYNLEEIIKLQSFRQLVISRISGM